MSVLCGNCFDDLIIVACLCRRDSLIVAIGDAMTCVFGGFVIFSFLGYMAGQLDVDVKDVVKDGE